MNFSSIYIYVFFYVFLCTSCNNPSIARKTTGEYVFNPYASSLLTREEEILFDKMTLKMYKNGLFEFSREIPDCGINGSWEVVYDDIYTHVMLHPKTGFYSQMSTCCDSKGCIYIGYKMVETRDGHELAHIAFKKIKNSSP